MNGLLQYLIGQMQHDVHSIKSEQRAINAKLDAVITRLDEALTWAQRLALMVLALLGAVGLNLSPDKAGEAIAAALKIVAGR